MGHEKRPDWPKLGPCVLIATAVIVASRTAKWSAKASNTHTSDVDLELDQEVSFAARISIRVMHELLRKHAGLFRSEHNRYMKRGLRMTRRSDRELMRQRGQRAAQMSSLRHHSNDS